MAGMGPSERTVDSTGGGASKAQKQVLQPPHASHLREEITQIPAAVVPLLEGSPRSLTSWAPRTWHKSDIIFLAG